MPTLLKTDEINLVGYDYSYTDRVMRLFMVRLFRRFSSAKVTLLRATDKKVAKVSRDLYSNLTRDARGCFRDIARHYYSRFEKNKSLPDDWLDDFLLEHNPTTKVVFDNELDRRAAKFIEAVISVDDRGNEVDLQMRSLSKLLKQYGDLVTDKSALSGMKDSGITRVKWVTARDDGVCDECASLNGQIFDIDDVPNKPHLRCRCTVKAVHIGE